MKIGGYEPLSLSDYPGHVAAVVFTQGCNWRCPFCHNGSLLPGAAEEAPLLSDDAVIAQLQQRRRMLDGVVISGGEPTLQYDLAEFIGRVKHLGLDVKLDTNGARPHVIELLLEKQLVDFIAMDIKAPWRKYPLLTGSRVKLADVQRSVALISQGAVAHEFRTTVVPALISEHDLVELRQQLPTHSPYRLQNFVQKTP